MQERPNLNSTNNTDTLLSREMLFDAIRDNNLQIVEQYNLQAMRIQQEYPNTRGLLFPNDIYTAIQGIYRDYIGETCLTLACRQGHVDIVRYLLSLPNINVNLYNEQRMTSLMVAARYGHADIVRVLLETPKVDILFRHSQPYTYAMVRGISAADLARNYHHDNCLELINRAIEERGLVEQDRRRARNYNEIDEPMPIEVLRWFSINRSDWFQTADYLTELQDRRQEMTTINLHSWENNISTIRIYEWIRNQQNAYYQELNDALNGVRQPPAPPPPTHLADEPNILDEEDGLRPPSGFDRLDLRGVDIPVLPLPPDVEPEPEPEPEQHALDPNTHPFLVAAYNGDLESVQAHLTGNDVPVFINLRDESGNTALFYAALAGQAAIVAELLSHREIRLDIENVFGHTAAYYAEQNHFDDIAARITELHETRSRELQETAALASIPEATIPVIGFQARLAALGEDAPEELCCPITQELMNDPIKVSSNKIFDRLSLINYFNSKGNPQTVPCPLTRIPIHINELKNSTDAEKNKAIDEYLKTLEVKKAEAERKKMFQARLKMFEDKSKKQDDSLKPPPPNPK